MEFLLFNALTQSEQKTLKAMELLIHNLDLLMDQELVNIDAAIHNELKRRAND